MGGVDLKTIGEILGHKTLAMTLRYAHLSPEHKRRAVRVLDAKSGHPGGHAQFLGKSAKGDTK